MVQPVNWKLVFVVAASSVFASFCVCLAVARACKCCCFSPDTTLVVAPMVTAGITPQPPGGHPSGSGKVISSHGSFRSIEGGTGAAAHHLCRPGPPQVGLLRSPDIVTAESWSRGVKTTRATIPPAKQRQGEPWATTAVALVV